MIQQWAALQSMTLLREEGEATRGEGEEGEGGSVLQDLVALFSLFPLFLYLTTIFPTRGVVLAQQQQQQQQQQQLSSTHKLVCIANRHKKKNTHTQKRRSL